MESFRVGQRQTDRVCDGRAQISKRDARSEVPCARGKNVAPVENVADIREPETGAVEVDHFHRKPGLLDLVQP